MVSKRHLIYWTPAELLYDLMTFGDTLSEGSSFGKLTSLMEHLPSKFMHNISLPLLLVVF